MAFRVIFILLMIAQVCKLIDLEVGSEFGSIELISAVVCGPPADSQYYPLEAVIASFNALVVYGSVPKAQKPKAGTRPYPQVFGRKDDFFGEEPLLTLFDDTTICRRGQSGMKFFEFPLTMPPFSGGPMRSQGPDRVIAISPTPGQGKPRFFQFCMAITHRGGRSEHDPSFRSCVKQPLDIECNSLERGEGRSLNQTMVWRLVAGDVTEAIAGTPTPAYQSIASRVSGNIASAVSEAISRSSTPLSEGIFPSASAVNSSALSIASRASKKIYAGAMAENVGDQQPILDEVINDDDDTTYAEKLQSILSKADDKYFEVIKTVSETLLRSASTQSPMESATSFADDQYSSAPVAASIVLNDTQKGVAKSVTSIASERYAETVVAASLTIYGTPNSATQATAIIASSLANSPTKVQYAHIESLASQQISDPPKPVHQECQSCIENAYSESLAAASNRLQAVLNSASTAVYGKPLSLQQSILSGANGKYSDAIVEASSQHDSAKSAIEGTSTPGFEAHLSKAGQRYSDLINAASSKLASAIAAASKAYNSPSQGVLESISSLASLRLADSLSIASAQFFSVKTAVGATRTPLHQQYLLEGQRRYYEAVEIAHERYSEFLVAASIAVYGTPTPTPKSLYSVASELIYATPTSAYQRLLNAAQAQYDDIVSQASDDLQKVLASASFVAGQKSKSPAQNILDSASSQYSSMLLVASASLSSVSAAASARIYGTPTGEVESEKAETIPSIVSTGIAGAETPWNKSITSQTSKNWEAFILKASEQVYGAPMRFSQSVISQARDFAAQATGASIAHYEKVQALFSELINGKEPDFTESVMKRLSSAYHAGYHASIASSASSYASNAYALASLVVSSVFTSPATLEALISAANDQVNAAIEAASLQYYGSSKSSYGRATSTAARTYSFIQSIANEAIYGTQPSFLASVGNSLDDVTIPAQKAISGAIYGTKSAAMAPITTAAASFYGSVSSTVGENVAAASYVVDATGAKLSEAVYGLEQGAVGSALICGHCRECKSTVGAVPIRHDRSYRCCKEGSRKFTSSVSSISCGNGKGEG